MSNEKNILQNESQELFGNIDKQLLIKLLDAIIEEQNLDISKE